MMAIDFLKAFYTLNRAILQRRTSQLYNNLTSSWFMSFLLNHIQRTKYCDIISDPISFDTGVFQGSALSATLFTLHITDLFNTLLPASSIAYADDVTIMCFGDNQAIAAANAVNFIVSVTKWVQENSLLLNSQKSQLSSSPFTQERSLQVHSF